MNAQLKISQHKRNESQTNARQQLSSSQSMALLAFMVALAVGLVLGVDPLNYVIFFIAIVSCIYLAQFLFTMLMLFTATFHNEADGKVDAEHLDWSQLPTYSVLVPLFKETAVLDQLIHNLCQLRYPTDKLHILLIVEEDDLDILAALKHKTLPEHFKVIIVPHSLPKTKPKALNVGLGHIDTELCTVYDAEDAPDPLQLLKAVVAFRSNGPKVACVQAALEYHNPRQNVLTRFFAAEYSVWFKLFIPGLSRHRLLFVLGGTSNHFKTAILRQLGGWDAYNVTEDADLGIRIARAGYEVVAINSVTLEEANSHAWNWVRQRSRWIKGYMQTYLVHMRNPLQLLRELGLGRFIVFQLMIGLAPLSNLMNPIFWVMTLLYSLTGSDFIESLFPGAVFYIGSFCLFVGNVIAVYMMMMGSLIQKEYSNLKWMFIIHFYWMMMAVAAWRAFFQLIFKPHYWEKTIHGLHLQEETSLLKT